MFIFKIYNNLFYVIYIIIICLNKLLLLSIKFQYEFYYYCIINFIINRGLGIGDWGLGPIPNPQSPIPTIYLKYTLFHKI